MLFLCCFAYLIITNQLEMQGTWKGETKQQYEALFQNIYSASYTYAPP